MDTNRQVDVPTLLQTIAGQLAQSQQGINQVSNSTHGDRMAQAFRMAAEAARQANTNDAGEQLQRAAQAMRQNGKGVAAGYYADGLAQAAQQVRGQKGISLNDLVPFLQSFVGGVQSNNPAKPGQGTMIDALAPALGALQGAQSSGSPQGGLINAIGAALSGAQSTSHNGQMDPGAVSAVNVIGGIIAALAPTLINTYLSSQQGQAGGSGGLGGLVGGLFGGQQQGGSGANVPPQGTYVPPQGGYIPPQGSADPFGGLGGLIGGLLGGQQGATAGGGIEDLGGGGSSVGGYGRPSGTQAQDQTNTNTGSTNFGDLLNDLNRGSDRQA